MLHFTAQENWRLRALVLVLFYFITMALTTHCTETFQDCCHALLAALVLTIGEAGG